MVWLIRLSDSEESYKGSLIVYNQSA